MRQMQIAMALIQQGDNYLLQHRKGEAKIGAAGMIGCFGGKVEEGESVLSTIRRELTEETNLVPGENDFLAVGTVQVHSDHQLEPVRVQAEVFKILIAPDMVVEASEGELVIMTKQEALDKAHKLTPATRATFKELL